ncbi:restriction endonuclease subunit S [Streptococcus oralis subsp. oralis]|uniref:restriction endonuclease subunit S n=1 Tax=Streptococcus TaxID=1301 RepID=UPI0008A3E9E2|nr:MULTISPECIES: restriction endonuclease subunit S [Streptococcus]OFR43774.1 restriction endonuclease subunit S [Streptococcus sp. HMSC062H02]ORO56002.1 restriction endonuclease subunit S [Streptococcus oralis subsp. oralis]
MIKVNKPKIRFKNFNDSWSLRKLSDTQTDFKDGNYGEAYPKETDLTSSTQGVPFLRGSDLDNGKLTLTNARYITQSKHNELISGHLIEDDIVIAVRGSLGSLGYVGPDNEGWNINSQLAIIRTRKIELIGNYLIQFLLSNRGNKEISSHITGTALKQLPIKQLKNIKVPIPKIEEQSAIGSLFRTLDDLMSSYKDNLANYQSLKASMLSKMFPKAGQTVPEIRLDGFEGDWELIKLGEVCDLITKGTTAKSQSEQGKVNFIKVENLKDNEIYSGVKISEEEHLGTLKRSILYEGDILFSIAGTLGRTAIVRNDILPANTNQALAIIRGYKLDAYFLLVVLSGEVVKDYIRKNPTVGAQPNLSLEQVSSLKIQVPSIKEQQAIGAYFSNLDNLINSYREKNSQLETLKKKLLQDMFI